jgi:PST family polysaccharide transporter
MDFKSKFKRIKESRDARILFGNFTALGILQIANYIFPLITLPYLAKVIGIEKLGEIAFAATIMIYFQTLVNYGFIFSSVRDIARCKKNREVASHIYSQVMWSRFCLTGLAFVLLISLIFLIPYFYKMRVILLLSFMIVPGHALFPDWMFQALEKMKYITIFNVSIKFLFTIAIFIFIKESRDYILQPVFNALGFLVSGVISMLMIHRWGYRLHKTDFKMICRTISANTNLFINELCPNLYNSFSVLILGFFHGHSANGIFDTGNKFNMVATNITKVISRVFYPFLSRNISKHKLYAKINIGLSVVMSIILFFFSPLIIRFLFSSEFEEAILIIQILSISLIFLAISNVYGTNYLVVKGYEKETRQITVKSSIVGFILAIPLVYFFSYIGAALTITISRGLIAIMIKHEVYKLENIYINGR